MTPKDFTTEKGKVVHIHIEPNDDVYIRQDDVYRLMEEYHQSKLKNNGVLGDVVSSADYQHLWRLMDELNNIMWNSLMLKGKDFGRQEGYKIMGLIDQWAERH